MTVIYFTDGALIDDVFIRRSLLRIPEVIESLRYAFDEFINCDLFLVMNEEDSYNQLNYHQKAHLKNLLQRALYKRWRQSNREPDLILRRSDYSSFADLAAMFLKLSTLDTLNVVTIGPGFDEIESFLRLRLKCDSSPLNEFISQDPNLDWFWTDVRSHLELHS